MDDLRAQLDNCLRGRVCLMGLGNPAHGDDGFGVRFVEALQEFGDEELTCVVAGTQPERQVSMAARRGFDHLVFVDAVDFGGAPGSLVLLSSRQMQSRFPQISTHKISLSLLAKWIEANDATRVWLLGVQPESMGPAAGLSPSVQASLEALVRVVQELKASVNDQDAVLLRKTPF